MSKAIGMENRKILSILFIIFVGLGFLGGEYQPNTFSEITGNKDPENSSGGPIIVLALDPLHGDRLSIEGYERNVTPHIDGLISDSVYFKNAYAPSTWTAPSAASVFTGNYPNETGVLTSSHELCDSSTTFAEVAKEQGYYTTAYVGGNHVSSKFNFGQGFKEFSEGFFFERASENSFNPPYLSKDKFLLYMQGFDVHMPYLVPGGENLIWGKNYSGDMYEKYPKLNEDLDESKKNNIELYLTQIDIRGNLDPRFNAKEISDEDLQHIQDMYDNNLYYADKGVGSVIKGLKESGRYKESTIIFYSHHGESLGKYGHIGHRKFYESIVNVPLSVKYPYQTEQKIVNRTVSLKQVYSIITAQVKGSKSESPNLIDGNDKVFSMENSSQMMVKEDLKMVKKSRELPTLRLYNTSTERRENIFEKRKSTAISMLRHINPFETANRETFCKR